jgi:hypothetical protein
LKQEGFIFCGLIKQQPEGREMFIVGASYLSLLQAVAARCSLPYVSLVSEVAGDGTPVYGIEVEVPSGQNTYCTHSFFFWAASVGTARAGYEQAALQAISFLQSLYGFVVVDYNFQGVILYRSIAQAAVSIAARAAGLIRLASDAGWSNLASQHDLVVESECFLKEVSVLGQLV